MQSTESAFPLCLARGDQEEMLVTLRKKLIIRFSCLKAEH